jgi:hypothetical protein
MLESGEMQKRERKRGRGDNEGKGKKERGRSHGKREESRDLQAIFDANYT